MVRGRLAAAFVAAALVCGGSCSSDEGGSSSPAAVSSSGGGEVRSKDHEPAPLYRAACDGDLQVGPGIDLPSELAEVSGIAPSSERADVVWAIGDGGSAASVYAIDLEGNLVATVAIDGVDNNDWEDLAAGPAPDGSGETWLYVADIGDNTSERERIRIQAFPEPALSATEVAPQSILASYSTGATDAEALAVTDDGIWILGKDWGGDPAPLYHLGFDAITADSATVPVVIGPPGQHLDIDGDLVTAMDAAPATGVLAVRSYGKLRVYDQSTADLGEVVTTEPCEAPPIVEGQGESVAVLADGRTIVTASEAGATRPAELHLATER